MIWAKRLALSAVILAGVLAAVFWLVAFSRFFAEPRGAFATRLLTTRLGLDVEIAGGVEARLFPETRLVARDVIYTGAPKGAVQRGTMSKLSFEIDLLRLMRGAVALRGIHVVGAQVDMNAPAPTSPPTKPGALDWAAINAAVASGSDAFHRFVSDKKVQVTKSELRYKNADNGLDLAVTLDDLTVSQAAAQAPIDLKGAGGLNGQSMTIDGAVSIDAPFQTVVKTDGITLTIDGAPSPDADGMTAKLSADIQKLAQLLDILKLQKPISGTGAVSAVFKATSKAFRIDDVAVQATLDSGQSVRVTGDLGAIDTPKDVSLATNIQFYPPDATPPATRQRQDLKLTGFEMTLTAQPDGVPLRTMLIQTNGFVLETGGKGPPPISVSEIKITPDGLLRIGSVTLKIGPPNSSFLVFDGSVADALRVEGIDVNAQIDLPAAGFVAPELFATPTPLGDISGGFKLKGNSQTLALSDLDVATQGTDLWRMQVSGSVGNALTFSDVSLDISADIPSGEKLMSALDLTPADLKSLTFETKLNSKGRTWTSQSDMTVGSSDLDVTLEANLADETPQVRGRIDSDTISFKDLSQLVTVFSEVDKLAVEERRKSKALATEDKPDAPPADQTAAETADPPDGAKLSDVTLQPIGSAILLSGMDMDIQIDLKKLEGASDVTSLQTTLAVKDELAQLGPVKFDYGGGAFDVVASIDLENTPDVVDFTGTADGWSLKRILQELRSKKGGSGVLNSQFKLSGSHKSIKEFKDTVSGDLSVSMRNGSIDTELLDLAGLGVVPWLFSDKHDKVAPIVCLRAPLRLDNGRINARNVVMETDRVQLVVNGDVDFRSDTLDIAGQPRRIGKPLSRSPWPFIVTGSLKHPKLKVKKGQPRPKAPKGASTMPKRRKICVPDIQQLR